jgi:FMN phosphatase YigB (HAD superfamily)
MNLVVIDLDDTLFCEQSYVESGFRSVARYIAKYNNIDDSVVFNQIKYQFNKYGRINVFDRTLSYFGFTNSIINDLVSVYREHYPDIELYCGVKRALEKLNRNFRTAIITDGESVVQKRKVDALKLSGMVNEIVYCMDYNAPKPSPISYKILADKMKINISNMIIVGDDPYTDMKVASILQIPSYRVFTGKYVNITSLSDALPKESFDSFYMVASYLEKQ